MKNRIKEIRLEMNLSQREFAEKINVARNTLSGYESGSTSIPRRSQLDICDKFNINEEWLVTGQGEKYVIPDEVNELDILMGMFNPEDDEFKTKIITNLLKLDDDGWEAIKVLTEKLMA